MRSSTASGLRALARRAVIVIGTVDALSASDNTSHCFERWWLGKPEAASVRSPPEKSSRLRSVRRLYGLRI